jgi:hypothetical protein
MALCGFGMGAGGLGCSSGDDDAGGTGGTGGTAPLKNVYVSQLRGSAGCLPRPLEPDDAGQVSCAIVEARSMASGACVCDGARGRVPVRDATNVVRAVEEYLRNVGECGAQGQPVCSDYCYCELQQLTGDGLLLCEGSLDDPGTAFGFCYVDLAIDSNGDGKPDANPALLAECKDTEKRMLRFLGADVPASDALAFIACEGATAPD